MPKTSAINRLQLGSGTGHKLVGDDLVVSALPTITTPHHEVHEGEYYGTGYLWFRLTNKSGGAQPASIEVTGYEHSA